MKKFDQTTYSQFDFWMNRFFLLSGKEGFEPTNAQLDAAISVYELEKAQAALLQLASDHARFVGYEADKPYTSREANRIVNSDAEFAIFVLSKLDNTPHRLHGLGGL